MHPSGADNLSIIPSASSTFYGSEQAAPFETGVKFKRVDGFAKAAYVLTTKGVPTYFAALSSTNNEYILEDTMTVKSDEGLVKALMALR